MTAILAYFVASMFCEIFGMAIETILLCYIADEEMFPPEKRFADGALKTAIASHGSHNVAVAVAAAGSPPQVQVVQVSP